MMRYCLLLLLLPVSVAWANEPASPINGTIVSASPLTGLRLASADGSMAATGVDDATMASDKPTPFKERWFTSNKLHKYLGLGSIGAAGLTLLTAGEGDEGGGGDADGGIHETFARTATALGGAAVLTGLLFHWDDIKLSNGFSDPDNLHMVLTTLGTLGYAKAVNKAPGDGHSGYGSFGAVSMALGIKMVW